MLAFGAYEHFADQPQKKDYQLATVTITTLDDSNYTAYILSPYRRIVYFAYRPFIELPSFISIRRYDQIVNSI